MAIRLVPTSTTQSHYQQVTTLDGRQFVLKFDWVQRWQRWTLGILSTSGETLLTGVPVVSNVDLLANHKYDSRLPSGLLIVLDAQEQGREPGLESFSIGGEFVLMYIEDTSG